MRETNQASTGSQRSVRRRAGTVVVGVLTATALAWGPQAGPVAGQAPAPHWGNYQWNNGAERANVRAFWLFDRTGDPEVQIALRYVVDAWNDARVAHPELPFIGIHRDDANAGRCFVNQTPGWSIATACTIPPNIEDVKALASRNVDANGHMIGGAIAIADGLSGEETLSVACHTVGHLMGLENSQDESSCMSHSFAAGVVKWYSEADATATLARYAHSESATTTTTVAPTTTTTTPATTTTTTAPTTTTTTVDDSTTTTTAPTTTTTVASTTTTTTTGLLEGILDAILP